MNEKTTSLKDILLIGVAIALICLFAFSIFKNIAYPLLWNDEAETAMFAKRILQYGYPKVHDGKNVLYLMELPDKTIGINKKTDAYIGTVWGHFYFAALGELFARTTKDLYLKTAFLRTPFALAGFLGTLLMAAIAMRLFKAHYYKLPFLILFLILEISSIPLALHMREVRYYSLVILLSACVFYLYGGYTLFKTIRLSIYIPCTTFALFLLFNTFPPAYFAFAGVIGLTELLKLVKKTAMKDAIFSMMPVFISAIIIVPLLIFFKTITISDEFMKLFNITSLMRHQNMVEIFIFLKKYEFLYVLLTAKILAVTLWLYKRPGRDLNTIFYSSQFLTVFCLFYLFLILKMPLPVIFERYYISLQPLIAIIILLDLFVCYDIIAGIRPIIAHKWIKPILLLLPVILFIVNGTGKIELMRNHVYELSNRYQGPLDYAIPFIRSQYQNTDDLVIATNYEECAYMYYLGSRTTIGYIGNNLEEDLKIAPDIIIFRKRWAYTNKREIFDRLFEMGQYRKISFPVFDNLVNNIPEINGFVQHLFKTRLAEDEQQALDLYIKQ